MSRSKNAAKNVMISFISQIATVLLSFICRKIFLLYLSVEYLGISSTFTSLLGALSLAELGIETAITFTLYAPLAKHDNEKIKKIMYVYKCIYEKIGFIVLALGIFAMPFIPLILKDIQISIEVYIIYLMQLFSTVSTYFLAYKRALFVADQKIYICKAIDMLSNVLGTVLRILSLLIWKDFTIYLAIQLAQTVISNVILSYMGNRIYPFLKGKAIKDKAVEKQLIGNVKNIFFAKLAGYIYGSTDNLVISTLISTASVGYLANYTQITLAAKGIIQSVVSAVQGVLGNLLTEVEDRKHNLDVLHRYTYCTYTISTLFFVPILLLIQNLITVWIGENYVLPYLYAVLIIAEMYISFVHAPIYAYESALGMFEQEKKISIIGSIMNLSISVIVAKILGITGVLLGTFISQMYFWVVRTHLVYKSYFEASVHEYVVYIVKNLVYLGTFVFSLFINHMMINMIFNVDTWKMLFLKGILIEAITIIINIIIFWKTKEQKYLRQMILNVCKRR